MDVATRRESGRNRGGDQGQRDGRRGDGEVPADGQRRDRYARTLAGAERARRTREFGDEAPETT